MSDELAGMDPDGDPADDILPVPKGENEGRTVVLLAVVEAASKVASFVMFMAVTRMLSVEDFGLFSWALSLSLLPVAFAVWGFGTTVVQHGSSARDQVPRLLTEAIVWRLILSVPVIALLALPIWGQPEYRLGLVLVGIASLADTFNELIRYAAGALMRQRAVAYNLLLQRIVIAAMVIWAVYEWRNPTAMAAAYCLGTLLGVAAMLVSAARIGLAPKWRYLTRSGMHLMWTRSHAVGFTGILNTLTFRSDTVLLGWLSTLEATGIYAAAYRLFETALFLVYSMARVTAPKMAAETDRSKLLRLAGLAPAILVAVFLPYVLVLMLRGADVMTLVFGSQYGGMESALTLAALGASLIPYALQFIAQSTLLSRKFNREVLVGATIALVVTVGVNLVLIPRLGAFGAGLGTMLALTVQWVYLRVLVGRRLGPTKTWPATWPALVAGLVMAPMVWFVPQLIVAAIAGTIVYGAVIALAYRTFRPDVFAMAQKVVRP